MLIHASFRCKRYVTVRPGDKSVGRATDVEHSHLIASPDGVALTDGCGEGLGAAEGNLGRAGRKIMVVDRCAIVSRQGVRRGMLGMLLEMWTTFSMTPSTTGKGGGGAWKSEILRYAWKTVPPLNVLNCCAISSSLSSIVVQGVFLGLEPEFVVHLDMVGKCG